MRRPARVRFVPTLNAGVSEVMGFHRHLLADRVRTGAFVEAVRRAVRPGDFVVDLGAGTGGARRRGCQEGAGAVIGVERTAIAARARALAAANDVRVTVVQGESGPRPPASPRRRAGQRVPRSGRPRRRDDRRR